MPWELIETDDVCDLPMAAFVAEGAKPVRVVSCRDFQRLCGGSTVPQGDALFFCRRSRCRRGFLWDLDWTPAARAARRLAVSSTAPVVPHEDPALPSQLSLEDALVEAAGVLRPGATLPFGLSGRRKERAAILHFLKDSVQRGGCRQALYMSGLPGTGKTACFLEAVETLQAELEGGQGFAFVHVNGLRLSSPGAVFAEILQQLHTSSQSGHCRAGAQLSEGQAYTQATRFFKGRRASAPVTVLLVDEVDYLVTPTQTVLYRIFEWLAQPGARLAVAAIANTMDLPEQMLPRVASRIGRVQRVDFPPYSRDELRAILDDRLSASGTKEAFSEDALRLCAARVSGDVRKALQVCRRAVETLLDAPGELRAISAEDIAAAEWAMLRANPAVQVIAHLGTKAQRLLHAFVIELQRRRSRAAPLRDVTSRYEALMSNSPGEPQSLETPSDEEVRLLTERLQAMALLRLAPLSSTDESTSVLELGDSLDVEDVARVLVA